MIHYIFLEEYILKTKKYHFKINFNYSNYYYIKNIYILIKIFKTCIIYKKEYSFIYNYINKIKKIKMFFFRYHSFNYNNEDNHNLL